MYKNLWGCNLMTFANNQFFAFISFILIVGFVVYKIVQAQNGKIPAIRRIAGLDAIEEAVGRATEMGRPVHYSPGVGALDAATFAGLELLDLVAKQVARYGADLIVTIRQPIVLPIAEEVVKTGYRSAGVEEAYNPDSVRFISQEQFAYAAGTMGIMEREQVAANLMLGYFLAESILLAETGFKAGAIQIAGTDNRSQVPFFVTTCDYVLIGEELFAAGAVASQNPLKLGSIAGQDLAKIYAIALLVIGSVAANFGITAISNLLSK
jgi:hypothetical protein